MLSTRTASWLACALLLALLGMPASAGAATAPSLEAPTAGASSFREGASMRFEWRGTLQGDPDTLSRSYFRIEIAAAADVPEGAQEEWTKLEKFALTDPGKSVTEVELGVPTAGSYRWRVCAWGVVDDMVANEIQQLPGGCSGSRGFESSAATDASHAVGELKIEERTSVPGRVETVFISKPSPRKQLPTPQVEQPAPQPVVEEEAPATFTSLRSRVLAKDGAALGLDAGGEEELVAETASGRRGVSGAITGGLGATLPFVPIPFWTLALLLACVPIARTWRRSVLAMFDWGDGSIDGRGATADVLPELRIVRDANALKVRSRIADGDAPASITFRGRRAA